MFYQKITKLKNTHSVIIAICVVILVAACFFITSKDLAAQNTCLADSQIDNTYYLAFCSHASCKRVVKIENSINCDNSSNLSELQNQFHDIFYQPLSILNAQSDRTVYKFEVSNECLNIVAAAINKGENIEWYKADYGTAQAITKEESGDNKKHCDFYVQTYEKDVSSFMFSLNVLQLRFAKYF